MEVLDAVLLYAMLSIGCLMSSIGLAFSIEFGDRFRLLLVLCGAGLISLALYIYG